MSTSTSTSTPNPNPQLRTLKAALENGAPGEMGIRTLHAGDTDEPPEYAKIGDGDSDTNANDAADESSSEDEAYGGADDGGTESDETSDEEVSEG